MYECTIELMSMVTFVLTYSDSSHYKDGLRKKVLVELSFETLQTDGALLTHNNDGIYVSWSISLYIHFKKFLDFWWLILIDFNTIKYLFHNVHVFYLIGVI